MIKRVELAKRGPRERRSKRHTRLAIAAAFGLLAVLSVAGAPRVAPWISSFVEPDRSSLRAILGQPSETELKLIYAERFYKPIWIVDGRPSVEATQFIERMVESKPDGLDPARYGAPALQRQAANFNQLSRRGRGQFEVNLTHAYGAFVSDLRQPLPGSDYLYTDPALTPNRPTVIAAIRTLAHAPFVRTAIVDATRMNPFYLRYRAAIAARAYNARDPGVEQLLRLNLERVRALPPYLGPRFVFVDVANKKLWLYENNQPLESMKVVVGKPDEATPAMAALIRYLVYNPYWNVPPDLTQRVYAPRILADRSALNALRMDPWSGFDEKAHKLSPDMIDWAGAVTGKTVVWLRQRPGPTNSMGAVKFMLPNEYGIYLHDTPEKTLFGREDRALSAGCIRVENYRRLARWLFAKDPGPLSGLQERRVDLNRPVPVYIAYLTAVPGINSVELRQDLYQRDGPLLRSLAAHDQQARASVAATVG